MEPINWATPKVHKTDADLRWNCSKSGIDEDEVIADITEINIIQHQLSML